MQRKFAASLAAAALVLTTTGCSAISDQLSGAEVPTAEATTSGGDTAPILQTTGWGVVDGMLSVVVWNTSDRTLRYAEGVVTARTDDNQLVASSLEYSDAACCQVEALAPGESYGFYVDVGDRASDITQVDVTYRNVSWASATEVDHHDQVTARPVALRDGTLGAVAVADITSDTAIPTVVAQAFLTDPDGKLVAVVSGRWTCVEPGQRRFYMQLFHDVPPGTRIDEVQVHRVADDPTRPAPECKASRTL
ncbi:MAG TPA: hypothetical protein VFT70_17005 [Nocardioides sp.]|nr:hypothetical protein [Nocardioides sp.]